MAKQNVPFTESRFKICIIYFLKLAYGLGSLCNIILSEATLTKGVSGNLNFVHSLALYSLFNLYMLKNYKMAQ